MRGPYPAGGRQYTRVLCIGQSNVGFYEIVVYKCGTDKISGYYAFLIICAVSLPHSHYETTVHCFWYLESLHILNKIYSEQRHRHLSCLCNLDFYDQSFIKCVLIAHIKMLKMCVIPYLGWNETQNPFFQFKRSRI